MKKFIVLILAYFMMISGNIFIYAGGFTADISKEGFTINVDDWFPSFTTNRPSDAGINNIPSLIVSLIPLVTTMMAIGATLMVIWGGFHMVLGGASTDQTEKGKGIMKDALIGLTLGLLAYVIIAFLGNILSI